MMVREGKTQRRNQLRTRSSRDPTKKEEIGGAGHREIEGKKDEGESSERVEMMMMVILTISHINKIF